MLNNEKHLVKIRSLFEKNQAQKAISNTSSLLRNKPFSGLGAQALGICNEFHQYDFVIYNLKKRLKNQDDILNDILLYGETLGFELIRDDSSQTENLRWLVSYIEKILSAVNTASGLVSSLAIKMGYTRASETKVLSTILTNFLSPLIKCLLENRHYSDALALESMAYEVYVKQAESEKAFAYFMSLFSEEMQLAGVKLQEKNIISTRIENNISLSNTYNVAFVIHHSSTLAHISSMLSFFEGLSEIENNQINPIVFSFSGKDPEMLKRCRSVNVKVVVLEDGASDLIDKIALLKVKIADEDCQAAVWLCLTNWMNFCFSFRIAKVQIWWSMKFHDYSSPDIDGYLCRFLADKNFFNGQWRGGFLPTSNLFDESKKTSALEIKDKYRDKIIYGTMGRSELINDKRFLGAVIQLLKNNQQAVYFWTGRLEDQTIVDVFKSEGVFKQTFFIGWVDTKIYAQVIDIYLDVFGFGTGFTLVESMAAGKPVVFLNETRDFSVLDVIYGLINEGYISLDLEQKCLFDEVVASNSEEYIHSAEKLAFDPLLRERVGEILAQISLVFENKKLSAEIYHQHITRIVDQTLQLNQDARSVTKI